MSKGTATAAPGFHLILVFLSLVLVTALPSSAGAQEQTFTLTDAVRYALEHNNEIRAAESSLAAKKDDVGVARSNLLPKVYFEERALRTNNPTYSFMAKLNQGLFTQQDFAIDSLNHPDPYNDFQTQFFAEQPIFIPKAWVGVDISKREHQAGSIDQLILDNEIAPIALPGGTLYLVGAMTVHHSRDYETVDALLDLLPSDSFSVLIHHYPERVDTASRHNVDLMLVGDTHGGQIRLPFIGKALTINFWHKYVMGKFLVGPTTLYVSRGLGMQGGIWPRMRLNCPPEMVLVTLGK